MDSPPAATHPGASASGFAGVHQSLKLTTIDLIGGIYCHICHITYRNKKDYDSHYASHNTGDVIVYTCVACHKEIASYPSFRGHCYTQHVTKDKFKCEYCHKPFSKWSALAEHIKLMHTFQCNKDSCNKQFLTKQELFFHQIVHKDDNNKPPYLCQNCEEQIITLDDCEVHIDKHYVNTYTCPICSEDIEKNEAAKHLSKHFCDDVMKDNVPNSDEINAPDNSSINIVGGILCCHCKELYKTREEFEAHFSADHSGCNLVYSCNICKKQFERYYTFGNHCYDHFSKDRFECDSCDRSFTRLSLLVLHTEARHASQEGDSTPFRCPKCPHAFQTGRRLREHQGVVHELCACYRCPEPGCNCSFDSAKDYILHRKHHLSLNNWCRQCGLQFPTLAACERHLDVHKKKLFSCPVCARQYGEKYLLLRHTPQHFKTVLHMCKICGKIFHANNRLLEHQKTHSSVKTFSCTYCGKGFMKKFSLKQHLNVHTGAKPYKCVACPKSFTSQPNWIKHMSRMHNIDHKTVKRPMIDDLDDIPKTKIEKPDKQDTQDSQTESNEKKDDNSLHSEKMSCDFESDDNTDTESINSALVMREALDLETDMKTINQSSDIGLIDDLPVENAAYVSDPYQSVPALQPVPPIEALSIPREYGPDFVNTGLEVPHAGEIIHLDDHILPHIDPLLINNQVPQKVYLQNLHNFQYENYEQSIENVEANTTWEPPVITKVFTGYYGDINDMSTGLLSVMNTDIF